MADAPFVANVLLFGAGRISGVMGDLGMHAAHVPLRLGWEPRSVYALLDDVVRSRPGPDRASS